MEREFFLVQAQSFIVNRHSHCGTIPPRLAQPPFHFISNSFFFFFFARIPVVGKLAVTATGAETGPVSGPGISKRASVYGVVRTPYRQQTDIQYVAHVTVGRDGEKKNRPTNRD